MAPKTISGALIATLAIVLAIGLWLAARLATETSPECKDQPASVKPPPQRMI